MTMDRLPHLIVEGFFATEKYTAKQGFGPDYPLPARDRTAHGNSVKSQLEKIRGENEQKRGNETTDDEPAPISIEGRDDEIPRYVIVSDFARIALHDLEEDATVEFSLDEFHRCVDNFAFIPGYKQHKLDVEDPINIRAVELLGELHDALKDGGYSGHDLERFLVRVLFCLFAEDTGLFERNAFSLFVENHTRPDGSDLGDRLKAAETVCEVARAWAWGSAAKVNHDCLFDAALTAWEATQKEQA